MATRGSSASAALKFKLDNRSAEPKSAQVALRIRELIEGGRLSPGDVMPSEDGLAERLGVGRKVVRHAYDRLVEEGLLVRDHPRNKRVAGKKSGKKSGGGAKAKPATKKSARKR